MLAALRSWGDRYAPTPGGPTTLLVHDACGRPTHPVSVCDQCGEPLAGEVHVVPGLGSGDPTFVGTGRPVSR